MKRNLSEVEERLLALLRENSRISIQEAAREIGTSRITVSRALESLSLSGKIINYTVTVSDDLRDMAIIHVNSMDGISQEDIVEYFSLIDGTYLLITYFEDLLKFTDLTIRDVKIARLRSPGMSPGRTVNIHCDYCGKIISDNPRKFSINKRTVYACCPTCEKGLKNHARNV